MKVALWRTKPLFKQKFESFEWILQRKTINKCSTSHHRKQTSNNNSNISPSLQLSEFVDHRKGEVNDYYTSQKRKSFKEKNVVEKMAANVGEIEKKQIIRAFQWQTDRIQKRKLSFCNCFESERVYREIKKLKERKTNI